MRKYRVNEACQVTGLSRKTIYRKMASGLVTYTVENGKRYITEEALKKLGKIVKTKEKAHEHMCQECVKTRKELRKLRDEIGRLTLAIETLTQTKDTTKKRPKKETQTTGNNAKRAEEAKQRLFSALNLMKEIPMYRGAPSITGIHKATGIDRGTISKYIKEYEREA